MATVAALNLNSETGTAGLAAIESNSFGKLQIVLPRLRRELVRIFHADNVFPLAFPESSESARHNGLQILANLKRRELFTDFPETPSQSCHSASVYRSTSDSTCKCRSSAGGKGVAPTTQESCNSEDLLER